MAVQQPDASIGPRLEEKTYYENQSAGTPDDPTVGTVQVIDGIFRLTDAVGAFDPRAGIVGDHNDLDWLGHELSENHWVEVTRTDNRVTNVTIWNQKSLPHIKIRECQVTRDSGRVSSAVEIQYDSSGVEVERITYTITRSLGKVSEITAVKSVP